MAEVEKVIVTKSKITNIANAIRTKTSKSNSLTLDEMPTEIENIQTGGAVLTSLYITNNGVYKPPTGVDGYNSITVDVGSSAGIPGINLLYYNANESITYTSTSAGTALTLTNITDILNYPFVIVNIENTDTSVSALKFIRSSTVVCNIGFGTSTPSITRYGSQQYYVTTTLTTAQSTTYGLWGYNINANKNLIIRGRCNSSYYNSLTGTYKVQVLGMNFSNTLLKSLITALPIEGVTF